MPAVRFLERATLVSATLSCLLVDGELNRSRGGHGAQVVHAGLETHLPAGKVHAGDLAHGGLLHVNVQGLGLIDEGTTIGSHLQDGTLGDFPDGLVEGLDVGGDVGDVLDGAAIGDDTVLHVVGPQAQVDKILQQPGVDDLELAGQDTARVDVGGVGLEALVVAEDLRGARQLAWEQRAESCGHRARRSSAFREAQSQRSVGVTSHMSYCRMPLRDRGACVGLVRAELLGQFAGSSKAAW